MADDFESGTYAVTRGPGVIEVERACNEVDIALADAVMCLDFLAERTSGEAERAVLDAQDALQRIGASIDRLRRSCSRASSRPPAPAENVPADRTRTGR